MGTTTIAANNPRRVLSSLADHMDAKGYPLHESTVFDYGREPGVIYFTDDRLTDAEAADLFADWVEPTGEYIKPAPQAVRDAAARLKARADAGDAVARDSLILFRYMNKQIPN